MAIEEPVFKSVLQDGAFEVRDYPALVVAEVTASGNQKEAASKGFRVLASYIFGGNKRKQSIAMTAPVNLALAGENIPMTAPVTQTKDAADWVVRFNLPAAFSLGALPEPIDTRVRLRVAEPGRFAVLRFSGLARQGDVAAKTAELQKLAAAHHLRAIGPVSLAQYNPPWTLWFMRRNEVMVPVAA